MIRKPTKIKHIFEGSDAISEPKKKDLEKQGYRLVGEHSAIKVCLWCKKSLRDEGVCYKQKFYGINSNCCVQMTPSLPNCTLRCQWCWRDIEHTMPKWAGKTDNPRKIIQECIKQHIKYPRALAEIKKQIRKNICNPRNHCTLQ